MQLTKPLQNCIDAVIGELPGNWALDTQSEINGVITNDEGVNLYISLEDIYMLRVHITETTANRFPSFRTRVSKYNAKAIAKKCQKLISQYGK